MDSTTDAAIWLRQYLATNRQRLTGPQCRTLSTVARQAPDGCTVGELAELLREEPCRIYGVGPVMATCILEIIEEPTQ